VRDLTIPKLNTVDVTYALVEWLFEDGDVVPPDSAVAVIETSKAATELVCADGGILHRLVEVPAECELGMVIGHIFDDEDERGRFLRSGADGPRQPDPAEPVVTRYALELMIRHGISAERVRDLGKKIVRRSDIERLAGAPDPHAAALDPEVAATAGVLNLSRTQRAVADAVTLSHRTIPSAFSVTRIYADNALALQRTLTARDGVIIGLPELLVKCVAVLHGTFPLLYACVDADGDAVLSTRAQVGITVDVGTGLYLPVVRDAASAPISEIARTLMEFRVKALRGQFRAADLADGNIAISLHHNAGIVLAQPLILPPHACMLALCSTQEELYRDGSGRLDGRSYFHLGLAYDHRVINGRQASLFLGEIKDIIESPERMGSLTSAQGGPHDW